MNANRRRRLLLVIGKLGAGGAELQLLSLVVGLARAGHEVTVACETTATIDLEPARRAGARILLLGAGRRTRFLVVPTLVRLARKADVVHCNAWDASLWGRIAGVLAGRPVVVTEHTPGREWDLSSAGTNRQAWIERHNRWLDRVTYVTVAVARWQFGLLQGEGVAADKMVHIPNGVLVEDLRRAAAAGVTRADLGLPAEARVVVHVARFQPHKNQRGTLELVARLREDLGDVRAVFVGDGPEREAVEAQARDMGADWALFLGRRQDVPALLALADLMVLPSMAEAMPMTIVESMAVGTPVLATDVGDVRRTLEGSGAGLWVPAGDPDALYASGRRLLSDDALREAAIRSARAASAEYDTSVMTRRYEAVFEGAIAGVPPTSVVLPGVG